MSDMPERIWMKPDDFLRTGTTAKDAAEYIRADLVERLRAALQMIVEDYEFCKAQQMEIDRAFAYYETAKIAVGDNHD